MEQGKEGEALAKAYLAHCSSLISDWENFPKEIDLSTEMLRSQGDPRQTICERARELKADYLFMGARGLSRLKGVIMGSVSTYVVNHAPCPVVVCRDRKQLAAEEQT